MSSFFDSLRPASFRNVPFEVESSDESGGRRLARHEYPLRDVPYAEDLGRKAGEWSVEGFIVQGRKYDYAKARDEMRKALQDFGPGTLVHPTLGEMQASVETYRMRESTREGGYCSFSITFVEPGQPQNPGSRENTAAAAEFAGGKARGSVIAAFPALYMPLPQELMTLAAELSAAVSLGMAYLSLPFAVVSEGLAHAQSLIALPGALAGAVPRMFEQVLGGGNTDREGYEYYGQASTAAVHRDPSALDKLLFVNPVTHTGNITALRGLVAEAVTLEDALATARQDFATADDALATRNAVLSGLDAVSPVLPDAVFADFSGVRLAVARDLTTRGGLLPEVRKVALASTIPSVLAAYKLYGDAGREGEIVRRNRVRHPGRVPGGMPLEILSR